MKTLRNPASFLCLSTLLLASIATASIWGAHYGDSPSYPAFVDSGAWAPTGPWLQDIAKATLGTEESCFDSVGADGGKPFYQMVIGINDPDAADFAALCFELWGCPYVDTGNTTTGRMPWCSEAISYWHNRAAFPYPGGLRNSDWFMSWQHIGTGSLINYYKTEESLGGRGRWVDYTDIDYANFWPGWNAPCPGAYVPIRAWDGTQFLGGSTAHSMMVDEMTIRRRPNGTVLDVELTFVEGNASNKVKAERVIDDLLTYTPYGSGVIDNYGGPRKFMGFGIDLNEYGIPVYDPDRIHWETVPWSYSKVHPMPDMTSELPVFRDPYWDRLRPELTRHALAMKKTPPVARPSTPLVQASRLPDGEPEKRWVFPAGLDDKAPDGVAVEVDLGAEHPLGVRGLMLEWQARTVPVGYSVGWAGADRKYREAKLPAPKEALKRAEGQQPLLMPVRFGRKGGKVRFLKFSFPKGTFKEQAVLADIGFVYDVPAGDAAENP